MLAMNVKEIQREIFNRLLAIAKRQIHQYFLSSINYAIRYIPVVRDISRCISGNVCCHGNL